MLQLTILSTRRCEEQLRELNTFLDKHELLGGVHRGFIRVFNNGDDPHFNWNKGARLYSQGEDSYQQLTWERATGDDH